MCSIKCGIAQQSRFISSPRSAFRQRRDRFSVKLRKMALPAASFEHYTVQQRQPTMRTSNMRVYSCEKLDSTGSSSCLTVQLKLYVWLLNFAQHSYPFRFYTNKICSLEILHGVWISDYYCSRSIYKPILKLCIFRSIMLQVNFICV